jgi:hypothetical protein
MPEWVLPSSIASLTVLLLNLALLMRQARERSRDWPAQFLRELHRWDGRLPDHTLDT